MKLFRWIGRHGALLLNAAWFVVLSAAIAAPILHNACPIASMGLYGLLRPLCHQLAVRSFFLAGYKMGLCARCTGLFAGLFAFGIIATIVRLKRGLKLMPMLILIAPLAFDGAAQAIGLWNTGNFPRFVTGLIAAFGIVFWVYPIIFEIDAETIEP